MVSSAATPEPPMQAVTMRVIIQKANLHYEQHQFDEYLTACLPMIVTASRSGRDSRRVPEIYITKLKLMAHC